MMPLHSMKSAGKASWTRQAVQVFVFFQKCFFRKGNRKCFFGGKTRWKINPDCYSMIQ